MSKLYENRFNIDCTKEYIVPMNPLGSKRDIFNSFNVKTNIKFDPKYGTIEVEKDGYQHLSFTDYYFDYLLKTNYIKEA